jgi:branched-chain amino acid transport system ATP-binding protein
MAVDDVDFAVEPNSITGLIGPNGAGKTTAFNLITGFEAPDSGTVTFKGEDITGLGSHLLVNKGMIRTFQIVRLFRGMSALENVMAGCYSRTSTGLTSAILGLRSVGLEEAMVRKRSIHLLEKMGLASEYCVPAGDLPMGRQRLLEIARALAGEPELLMLDEPAAGLNTAETETLAQTVRQLRESGITVLLIEHNMSFMMQLADYIYVLDFGKLIAKGTSKEIANSETVINAYLGKEFQHA